ncbi:biopolymer transporter Tol [Pelagicoccus mobilis]
MITLPFAGVAFAQIDGGTVNVRGIPATTPVVVASGNSSTKAILTTAFRIHGGFEVVNSSDQADFVITVDPVGSQGARLSITSAGRSLLGETVAGSSSLNAVYKAIDRAIYKTRGKKGFFSGKIAFISEETGFTEVCTTDLLFRKISMLTQDRVSAVRPRWSPDGSSIVYTSYKAGFPDIYRLDLRNNRREVIANYKGLNMDARYSPDGTRIAMIISGGKNADVWVRESSGRMKNLTKSRGLEASPSWSPDGTRLVFSSDERGGPQLYVMPSHGGSYRRLATNISGHCAQPDWNPEFSNQIAFSAAIGSGRQIVIFDSTVGKSRIVSNDRGDAIEPQWLKDGRHLLYTHRRANRSEIKILDSLSGKSYVISGSRTKVSQPSYVQ